MLKKQVERLVPLGVLEVANDSERGASSFAQPKPESNRVHFINEFKDLK